MLCVVRTSVYGTSVLCVLRIGSCVFCVVCVVCVLFLCVVCVWHVLCVCVMEFVVYRVYVGCMVYVVWLRGTYVCGGGVCVCGVSLSRCTRELPETQRVYATTRTSQDNFRSYLPKSY